MDCGDEYLVAGRRVFCGYPKNVRRCRGNGRCSGGTPGIVIRARLEIDGAGITLGSPKQSSHGDHRVRRYLPLPCFAPPRGIVRVRAPADLERPEAEKVGGVLRGVEAVREATGFACRHRGLPGDGAVEAA